METKSVTGFELGFFSSVFLFSKLILIKTYLQNIVNFESLPYDKRQMYDFDLRVPLLVRGPGIDPGTSSQAPVISVDLAPTIINLMSHNLYNDDKFKDKYDGQSIVPLFGKSVLDPNPPEYKSRENMLIEYHGESDATLPGKIY